MIPGACAVVSVVAAYLTARLDRLLGDAGSAFLFPGPPGGARSFLGAVIGAMISFTGLVFSITVVVLVLTSGQFSPRVLRQFLRDRTIQWSLGLFVATFLFAMTVLREVLGDGGPDSFVPRISVTAAFALVLASVGMFVAYIDHVVHMIQVSSIIDSIAGETRELLETRYPPDPAPAAPAPSHHGATWSVVAPRPGVITAIDEDGLVERARRDGVSVVVAARVGDFLPSDATLLTVQGDRTRASEGTAVGTADGTPGLARYARTVCQGTERTMDQDVAFGFRQLVDIATKALSPSINDPTTATQVVDALHELLRRLVTRSVRPGHWADTDGVTRLVVPSYDVADLIEVTLTEIWHYGGGSTQIPERLTGLLDDLHAVARPEHRDAVATWLDTVRATTRPDAAPTAAR